MVPELILLYGTNGQPEMTEKSFQGQCIKWNLKWTDAQVQLEGNNGIRDQDLKEQLRLGN
jgi:hypothetical protein